MRQLCFLLIVSSWSVFGQSQPNVLTHYPQCDFQVLDTVSVSRNFASTDRVLTQATYAENFSEVIDKIRQRGVEVNADGVILLERELNSGEKQSWSKNQGNSSRVTFTAQLIKNCLTDPSLPLTPTPFDQNGLPQKTLQLGKIGGWQKQIQLALPSNTKRLTPKLANPHVSFEDGVYGVTLGTGYQDVIARFGTPTFVLRHDAQTTLIAYGRNHWLRFNQNRLVDVTTDASWFSSSMLNMLVFEQRFDGMDWRVFDRLEKGSELANNQLQSLVYDYEQHNNQLVFRDGKQQLIVKFEQYQGNTSGQGKRVISGFSLQYVDVDAFSMPKLKTDEQMLQTLQQLIHSSSSSEIKMSDINADPIAKAWLDSSTTLYIMGPHVVIEETGNQISKVSFLERTFNSSLDSHWSFNGVQQGQSFEHALAQLGDDAFYFDDLIEISGDNYSQNFYFYQNDGTLRLFSSELTIF